MRLELSWYSAFGAMWARCLETQTVTTCGVISVLVDDRAQEESLLRYVSRGLSSHYARRRRVMVVMTLLALGAGVDVPRVGLAQGAGGTEGAAVAGAALGLYSGATLGGLASLIPCNKTLAGVRCVRGVTALGGGIGLASGIALGSEDQDAVWDAYRRAGFGLVAGSVAVLALKPFVDRWSWADVGAGAVIGSSIAAGGSGAWIGLVLGMGVGVGLWQVIPSFDLPEAISVGLAGMAIGGFTSWIIRAANAGSDTAAADLPVLTFNLGVPW